MPKIVISTGELPKFSKKLFERLTEIVSEKSRNEAETIVKKQIKKVNAVASGKFFESVTSDIRKSGTSGFLVSVGSDDRAAEPLETGLKPTRVPIVVILKWMKDKHIKGGSEFAVYVQRKLSEQGYEGRHIFEKSEEILISRLDDLINDILNQEELFEK